MDAKGILVFQNGGWNCVRQKVAGNRANEDKVFLEERGDREIFGGNKRNYVANFANLD